VGEKNDFFGEKSSLLLARNGFIRALTRSHCASGRDAE
jgi:hypothetical protein